MSQQIPKAKLTRTALEAAEVAGVRGSARHVLGVLVALAWEHDDGCQWAVSREIDYIARRAGLSSTTTKDGLRVLRRAGLIEVRRTGRASVYVLTEACRDGRNATIRWSESDHQIGEIRPSDGRNPTIAASDTLSTFSTSSSPPTGAAADAAGGGGAGRIDQGAGLDGRAAVVFERLSRRPAWATGRWITPARVRELAELEHVTLEVVDAALAEARQIIREDRRGRIGNPAGIVISLVREPDMHALERERERRRAAAEADRRAQEAREGDEAARRASEAIAAEAALQAAQTARELGPDAVDAAIAHWLATEAPRIDRDRLWHRTPEERRRSLERSYRLGAVLERWLEVAT